MQPSTTAKVFNIQKFCLHDGPGIRTIIFFKGCPLRCKWCSNPESQSFLPELLYHSRLCIRCGICEKVCPNQAITLDDNGVRIDHFKCQLCGACVEECPSGALTIAGKSLSIASIMNIVRRDRHYYENSGGGVTLSGGEPFAQPESAIELLRACKREGFHTAVETCGHFDSDIVRKSHGLVDLFLFDVKEIEPTAHQAGTGMNNSLILENLTRLSSIAPEVVVRIPLIPTFNMQESFYQNLTLLIKKLGISRLEIVPYHRLGLAKYDALGRRSDFIGVPPLTNVSCHAIVNFIRDQTGADVTISH